MGEEKKGEDSKKYTFEQMRDCFESYDKLMSFTENIEHCGVRFGNRDVAVSIAHRIWQIPAELRQVCPYMGGRLIKLEDAIGLPHK